MTYFDRIRALKAKLEAMQSPARLDIPFAEARPPTQAFSEFLTNKEQGDWAENTLIANFNQSQRSLWVVKYGRSEDLVAGEPGFDEYYRTYQTELRDLGKRPDLLIFHRDAFIDQHGEITDVSRFPLEVLAALVPTALAALEVRSSAFISRRYDETIARGRQEIRNSIVAASAELARDYRSELVLSAEWRQWVDAVVAKGIDSAPEAPRALGRRSTERLAVASGLTSEIKRGLKALAQREFLSLTPKAEDLTLVYRWIEQFGVPHYYCQVFFDRGVILSFEEILEILAAPERENKDFFIEADEKNQGKVTFKINVALGREVLSRVSLPAHSSAMKELPRGRLLFYVKFEASKADVADVVVPHG